MSVSADPSAIAEFDFTTANKETITFRARFITRRQKAEYRRLIESVVGKSFEDADVWERVRQSIAVGVVGWTLSEPFSFDALEEKFTEDDFWKFAQRWPSEVSAKEREVGKSSSLPTSPPGESAETASAASVAIHQP